MAAALLSVLEARSRVLERCVALADEEVSVADALGRVLAEEVRAAHDVPPFANSAMDGFAVGSASAGQRLPVVGEARAGTPSGHPLAAATAMRISTGAALPDGAQGVIAVENVLATEDGHVTLGVDITPGANVRPAGDDLRARTPVLGRGTRLGPAALGLAVSAGRARLHCARLPRMAVITTGDELVDPGSPLSPGQIHDSNAVVLAALGRDAGARVQLMGRTCDDPAATAAILARSADAADVVIVCGGVSVGPHDHVKAALRELGFTERFWRVALKPGKPVWFGDRASTLAFGLPGNPVSAMVTFLLFVVPALAARQGADPDSSQRNALISQPVAREPGRDQAVRVRLDQEGATLLATPNGPQGSHQMRSMLGAQALALVPAGAGELAAGDPVTVTLIDS